MTQGHEFFKTRNTSHSQLLTSIEHHTPPTTQAIPRSTPATLMRSQHHYPPRCLPPPPPSSAIFTSHSLSGKKRIASHPRAPDSQCPVETMGFSSFSLTYLCLVVIWVKLGHHCLHDQSTDFSAQKLSIAYDWWVWFTETWPFDIRVTTSARFYLNFPTGKLFGKLSFIQKNFVGGGHIGLWNIGIWHFNHR